MVFARAQQLLLSEIIVLQNSLNRMIPQPLWATIIFRPLYSLTHNIWCNQCSFGENVNTLGVSLMHYMKKFSGRIDITFWSQVEYVLSILKIPVNYMIFKEKIFSKIHESYLSLAQKYFILDIHFSSMHRRSFKWRFYLSPLLGWRVYLFIKHPVIGYSNLLLSGIH